MMVNEEPPIGRINTQEMEMPLPQKVGQEEEEILIEMQNMHDYNSHFPEQGDSLHESLGGGNIILTGVETTPMAASH